MHFDWRSFLDWVTIASALATVLAAGLAAWAIWQAARQARENTQLVVDERRRDVQLDALQRLGEIVAAQRFNDPMHWQARRSAAVQLAVIEADLPVCRARFGSADPGVVAASLGLSDVTGWLQIDGALDSNGRIVDDVMVEEIAAAVRGLALEPARHRTRRAPSDV